MYEKFEKVIMTPIDNCRLCQLTGKLNDFNCGLQVMAVDLAVSEKGIVEHILNPCLASLGWDIFQNIPLMNRG